MKVKAKPVTVVGVLQRQRGSDELANFNRELIRLRITVATGLICGIGLSWKLWVSSRLFPLSPVTGIILPAIPYPLDSILAAIMLASLIGIIAAPRPMPFLAIFLTLAGFLSAEDQMRWQPWFYQYFFVLAAMAFDAWRKPDSKSGWVALDACRLIVIATYFWGGMQKLNFTFVQQTWPSMSEGIRNLLPSLAKIPAAFILAIPLIEMAIAVGLIMAKTRRLAVTAAIATHVAILGTLISSGENLVVWPWNAALILIDWILFWGYEERTFFKLPKTVLGATVFVLFGFLPALSFIDAWDSYLSAALYSGNVDQGVIYLDPAAIARLPQQIRPHIWQASQPFFLDINRWAYGELNVPVYPEARVFRKVTEQVCTYLAGDQSSVRLRIFLKPNPLTGVRQSEFYDCDHLRDP